ncbi:acyl-CoA synthetase (AMP-forming)/AMP-acid ligase II [Saccharopolyspora lacisalsi]|uniref:Acyl-CoA synthetase (AMP-forming)/AMP-acid ligase II n=1 Tax=Halosaccharopolyspora lacisalsi TaxID=1000566 RepID=A0A839DXR3_9PSEU|nr:AMP-binding protein [Halosaccharopolyspora lacisalsi]MBA8824155.1 acyl-CoA synthetase (AMP-forming)/AMP-acid ligase II [Halosaccharopolyspora lacisalsi]
MELRYLPWNRTSPLRQRWEHIGLRDDRVELTYEQFSAWAEAFAEQLGEHGFGRGDVLAILLPNRVELLVAMFAAWRLGGAATPVNPVFTEDEAEYQITDAGASLVVTLAPDAPNGDRSAIHVDDMRTVRRGEPRPPAEVEDDDLALLIYTSGSTGRPKGVMLDHRHAEVMSATMAHHLKLTEDDHCLLILPLFHVNAIMVSVLAPMRCGGQVSIAGQFSATGFFDQVEWLRPTYFSAVPTIYAVLAALPGDVHADISSLRFVICGAAPASPELLTRLQERYGFEIVEGYGLTEGTCASSCNPVDGIRKIGTVGPALPSQEIRITGPDGSFLPAGEDGEVVISGPTVMRGYLNRPEATAETIVDGWLHTGDVGRLDADGYLTIVDRLKDMIIRGGENIYPKEIEAVLTTVNDVLESAVVGRSDEMYGEVPIAYVSVYPDSRITEEQLLDHCRRHLTRVKVPERIHVVGTLPKNPVGKIDKPTLRRNLNTQPA